MSGLCLLRVGATQLHLMIDTKDSYSQGTILPSFLKTAFPSNDPSCLRLTSSVQHPISLSSISPDIFAMVSFDTILKYLAASSTIGAGANNYISSDCPLLGPDLATPTALSSSPAVQAAVRSFPEVIEKGTYGSIDLSNSTFSASVFSAADNETIYTWYNTANSVKRATTGINAVDGDSVYRLGSISKLLTVYAWLTELGDGYWHQSITQYVPELKQASSNYSTATAIDQVDWEDITLGELAGHMAGIARDGMFCTAQSVILVSQKPSNTWRSCSQHCLLRS